MSFKQRKVAGLSLAAGLAAALAIAGAQAQQSAPKLDVHFVPTPMEVVERMLEVAKVGKDDYLIDLGSGDGRIPIAAAKKFGTRGMGVDLDPQRIKEAKENAEQAGVADKVTFVQQNLFETKISDASVVTMYLLSRINRELRPRLLAELKPGTRVVSHAFDMGDWDPQHQEVVNGRQIYMWIIPAKVNGRWEIQQGGRRFTVDINQSYQQVIGSATVDGRSVPLLNGRVDGTTVRFVVELDGRPTLFHGQVGADGIQGLPAQTSGAAARQASEWRAIRSS